MRSVPIADRGMTVGIEMKIGTSVAAGAEVLETANVMIETDTTVVTLDRDLLGQSALRIRTLVLI